MTLFAALALLGAAPAMSTSFEPTIAALAGQARVMLLFAPDGSDTRLVEQRHELAAAAAGLRERDVRVVIVAGDGVANAGDAAADLRRRYGVAAGTFAVRLIGKDGHVALRSDVAVTAPALFATIDAMPMRRDEMRRR